MTRWFLVLLLMSLGLTLHGQESQDGSVANNQTQVQPNKDFYTEQSRPCLVFADGRKVLLKAPAQDHKGLVSFILLDGRGPYNARRSELDWPATLAGCPLDGQQQKVSTPTEKVVRNEDLPGLGSGRGTLSTMGTFRSGLAMPKDNQTQSKNNPYQGEYPAEDDRSAWQTRGQELRDQISAAQDEVHRLEAEFSHKTGTSTVQNTNKNRELTELNAQRREADKVLWRLERKLGRLVRRARTLGYDVE